MAKSPNYGNRNYYGINRRQDCEIQSQKYDILSHNDVKKSKLWQQKQLRQKSKLEFWDEKVQIMRN